MSVAVSSSVVAAHTSICPPVPVVFPAKNKGRLSKGSSMMEGGRWEVDGFLVRSSVPLPN